MTTPVTAKPAKKKAPSKATSVKAATAKVTAVKAAPVKATTAKAAAVKTAAKPAQAVDAKKAAPAKKRAPRQATAMPVIEAGERQHLIAVAAYYLAERRGFVDGSPHDDWLLAEREIDAMIVSGKFSG